MKYFVLAIIGLILACWGMIWCITHFYFILRTVIPVALVLSFVGGCFTGWWLKGRQ